MKPGDISKADMPLGQVGVWGTIGYLCLLGALTEDRLSTVSKLSLNEVGDFLAGAFGPLAVFWLILGFFQQGKELSLQIEELRRSVQQQESVASASRTQADAATQLLMLEIAQRKDAEVQAQPAFRSGATQISSDDTALHCEVALTNLGASCFDVRIESDQILKVYPVTQAQVRTGDMIELHWSLSLLPGAMRPDPSEIRITYRDIQGRFGGAKISVAYGLKTGKAKVDPRYVRGTLLGDANAEGQD